MTLVVARIVEGTVVIVADTLLTHEDGLLVRQTDGAIKALMCGRDLTVCFAGHAHLAARSLALFRSTWQNDKSWEELTRYLLDEHVRTNGSIEFMLVTREPRIAVIKNGVVLDTSAGYIGDLPAFAAFQAYRGTLEQPHEDIQGSRVDMYEEPVGDRDLVRSMCEAMRLVINDERFPTVGGIPVALAVFGQALRYVQYITSQTGLLDVSQHLEMQTLPIGDPRTGQHTRYVHFGYRGFRCFLATYLPEGGFGMVYGCQQGGMDDGLYTGKVFRAWTFGEFLYRVSKETNLYMWSNLPATYELQSLVVPLMPRTLGHHTFRGPPVANRTPWPFVQFADRIDISHFITLAPSGEIRDRRMQLVQSSSFLHLGSSQRVQLVDLLLRQAFESRLLDHESAVESLTLQIALPKAGTNADDRYLFESESGEEEILALRIAFSVRLSTRLTRSQFDQLLPFDRG